MNPLSLPTTASQNHQTLEALRRNRNAPTNDRLLAQAAWLLHVDVGMDQTRIDTGFNEVIERVTISTLARERRGTLATEVGSIGMEAYREIGPYARSERSDTPQVTPQMWQSSARNLFLMHLASRIAQIGNSAEQHYMAQARLDSYQYPQRIYCVTPQPGDLPLERGGPSAESLFLMHRIGRLLTNQSSRPLDVSYNSAWSGY